MKKFKFTKTLIKDLCVIEPKKYSNQKVAYIEHYNYYDYKIAGIDRRVFVSEREIRLSIGMLMMPAFQERLPQAMLIRAVSGNVFNVVVDVRKGSATYKRWFGTNISEDDKKMLFVPEGCAHGFLVLSEKAELVFKCSNFNYPENERVIAWNDEEIGIKWPIEGMKVIVINPRCGNKLYKCDIGTYDNRLRLIK